MWLQDPRQNHKLVPIGAYVTIADTGKLQLRDDEGNVRYIDYFAPFCVFFILVGTFCSVGKAMSKQCAVENVRPQNIQAVGLKPV